MIYSEGKVNVNVYGIQYFMLKDAVRKVFLLPFLLPVLMFEKLVGENRKFKLEYF